MRVSFIIISLLFVLRAEAAMVRVVAIQDGRTITIEGDGTRRSIRLAGVAITEELRAADLLRWTVGGHWVLLEQAAGGGFLVYRSPDALFVNRELVLRGFATPTLPGIEPEMRVTPTYLGVFDPPAVSTKKAAPPKSATAPGTRSGKSSRPRDSPSRRGKARPASRAGS
jgi:hypothetical protein